MSVTEILEMSEQEKLHTMELLWESLAPQSKLDAPAWHDEVIDERITKIEAGETRAISLAQFKQKYS